MIYACSKLQIWLKTTSFGSSRRGSVVKEPDSMQEHNCSGGPVVAQQLMNLTGMHEDTDSVDLVLAVAVV